MGGMGSMSAPMGGMGAPTSGFMASMVAPVPQMPPMGGVGASMGDGLQYPQHRQCF